MNREIKFRGRRRDNGKWVRGNLMIKQEESPVPETTELYKEYYIIPIDGLEYFEIPVDSDTVGQYTGLKDKNGKEIYEGDIVKCLDPDGEDDYLSLVRYDGGAFTIDVHFCDYDYTAIEWALDWHIDDVEIIGNIHDNPELIKK